MVRLASSELRPGMVVAEDVYTYTGQLLLPIGAVLTDNAITKLEFYSIMQVRVEDPKEEEKDETEPPAVTFSEKIKASPEFKEFKATFTRELPKFKRVLEYASTNKVRLQMDVLNSFTVNIMGKEENYVRVFDMLHNMREYDDATYVHSINVALMCNAFARWLKLSEEDVQMATICGLLHDIGKIAVPKDIIEKPDILTDDEFLIVKRHTIDGYNYLKPQKLPDHVRNTALMHHERNDGSGYPLGVKGEKIDFFAKLVAIVDVYDAMTSARCYRGPLCPFKVVAIFESEGLIKYDIGLIMTFLENIVNTYISNTVRLSDGRCGEIVYINKNALSKPTVQIGNEYVNLSITPNLYIEEVL